MLLQCNIAVRANSSYMNSQVLVLGALWLACTPGFGATCQNKAGKTIPIRVAERAEYSKIRDGLLWPNPSIVILEKGFAVLVRPSNVWGRSLTFEDTLITLDQQSCDAWTFGAVVWLSETDIRSSYSADAEADMKNRLERLKDAFERRGIVVILVPSA